MEDIYITDKLNKFKSRKTSNSNYYNKIKTTDDFKMKNRLNSKLYYEKNKEYINAKNLCNYYIKNDKLEEFMIKHNDKYNILFLNN